VDVPLQQQQQNPWVLGVKHQRLLGACEQARGQGHEGQLRVARIKAEVELEMQAQAEAGCAYTHIALRMGYLTKVRPLL